MLQLHRSSTQFNPSKLCKLVYPWESVSEIQSVKESSTPVHSNVLCDLSCVMLCALCCGLLCFGKLQILKLHYSDIEIHHCGLSAVHGVRSLSSVQSCMLLELDEDMLNPSAQTNSKFLSNISALMRLTYLKMQVPGADEVDMHWLNNLKALRYCDCQARAGCAMIRHDPQFAAHTPSLAIMLESLFNPGCCC